MDVTQVIRNEELSSAVIEASLPEFETAYWLQSFRGSRVIEGFRGLGFRRLGFRDWGLEV